MPNKNGQIWRPQIWFSNAAFILPKQNQKTKAEQIQQHGKKHYVKNIFKAIVKKLTCPKKKKKIWSIIREVIATLFTDLSRKKKMLKNSYRKHFIENPWILRDPNAVNLALQAIGLDKWPLPWSFSSASQHLFSWDFWKAHSTYCIKIGMDSNRLTGRSPLVTVNGELFHGGISRTSPTWISSYLKVMGYCSQQY